MHCKCFWHKKGCARAHTGPSAPTGQKHINLKTIPPSLPTNPNYVSSIVMKEILIACCVELEKNWMLQVTLSAMSNN